MLLSLQRSIASAEEAVSRLRFNKKSPLDHFTVGLFVSLIERASSIHLLLCEKRGTDAKLILRSALEVLVELEILAVNPDHIWNVQHDFCKKQILILEMAECGNPYLAEIKSSPDLERHRQVWKMKLNETIEKGGKSLKVELKFAMAGRKYDYDALYRNFSHSAHASYAGIIDEVFEVDPEKDDFEISLYSVSPEHALENIAVTASVCVDDAIKAVSRYLGR
ncbi:MAG: DUF5677 domain-containing protein [Rhodobacteraceae bacterium]|nr:DUF5677 domain-containing protein [Paracoccaceae bacterium]